MRIRDACAERLASERAALTKFRASGGKVAGYTCNAFPAAVLAGSGLWPVRVLCGTSSDSESAGEKIVRADVCPLVKSLLGNVAEGKSLHAEIDLWIGLYTCDQMRRGMNCLSEQLGKEVHPVQLPATRTDDVAGYYAVQVKRLVSDIETRHNLPFDEKQSLYWTNEYNDAAKVLSQAARAGFISPLDIHAMFHLLFNSRPFGLARFFEKIIISSDAFRPEKTVVLTGSPLTLEDTVLLEELENRGFGVIPLNCTGLNAVEYEKHVEIGDNTIESLALAAFHRPPCSRARPNTVVYERIKQTITDTGAKGLIVKCMKFCDQWYTERERMRRTFDIPVLVFDSDYAAGGRERLLSRIDAFLEML
ncbi:MAG: 2-hydroxyacyl-CoA dehydratase [Nitrospirae bacterium]|nr:MAG: 2-hydroxyacyl-CoA dehydratase [Nitrospirota bacterium]